MTWKIADRWSIVRPRGMRILTAAVLWLVTAAICRTPAGADLVAALVVGTCAAAFLLVAVGMVLVVLWGLMTTATDRSL